MAIDAGTDSSREARRTARRRGDREVSGQQNSHEFCYPRTGGVEKLALREIVAGQKGTAFVARYWPQPGRASEVTENGSSSLWGRKFHCSRRRQRCCSICCLRSLSRRSRLPSWPEPRSRECSRPPGWMRYFGRMSRLSTNAICCFLNSSKSWRGSSHAWIVRCSSPSKP